MDLGLHAAYEFAQEGYSLLNQVERAVTGGIHEGVDLAEHLAPKVAHIYREYLSNPKTTDIILQRHHRHYINWKVCLESPSQR